VKDAISQKAGDCCSDFGELKKPYRYQTGMFGLDRQARGVVTGITTQDGGATESNILMAWT
jgi:hypothetical protein